MSIGEPEDGSEPVGITRPEGGRLSGPLAEGGGRADGPSPDGGGGPGSGDVAVRLGPRASFEVGGARSAVADDGRAVAVFELDGELHALAGRCLHRGGPLADGFVRDGVVTCPLHWWRYDIRTGALVGDPTIRLERYPIEIVDGDVLVHLPPVPPRPASIRERLLTLARATDAGLARTDREAEAR